MKTIHSIPIAALLTAFSLTGQLVAEELPVSRVELLVASLEKPVSVGKLLSQRIEMAPQVSGSKHYHPIPVLGYVVSGKIAFQIDGEDVQILSAGDAFYEPANAVVVRWENIGSTRAVFVANYLAANDSDELLVRVD